MQNYCKGSRNKNEDSILMFRSGPCRLAVADGVGGFEGVKSLLDCRQYSEVEVQPGPSMKG